jgi:hypothetical protein
MATPMTDENVEKLLEPFRAAVKVQVRKKEYFFIFKFHFYSFRETLLNN